MIGRPEPAAPTAAGTGHEVELKYRVDDPAALEQALDGLAVEGVTVGDWRVVRVRDRYFDTADEALRQAGYGARLRRVDGQVLVTVKSIARIVGERDEPEALHRREELESPALDALDPARWPESPARDAVVRMAAGRPLRTLFTVDQERRERPLTGDDASALLSLDRVEVRRGPRVAGRFATLEVESTGGAADGLLRRVADGIDATGLAVPEGRSKEAIARDLLAAEPPARPAATERLPVPSAPGVRAEDLMAEAGRKVLRLHLARMLAHEAAARRGGDPTGVHKMRVATRRMRAVWRVFDGAYRGKVQKRQLAELRTVAEALGRVRDLDVQLEALERHAAGVEPDVAAGLEPLTRHWRTRRDEARDQLVELLDSKSYATFIDDAIGFVERPGLGVARSGPLAGARVRDVAAGRIWQAYERVRVHDAGLPWADVPALHALRIDGKRLRYTLESFREVLDEPVGELIEAVTAMQDQLGELNDAQVAADLVRGWLLRSAADLPGPVQRAAGGYLLARERAVPRLRRSFPPVWRRVAGPPFRRRLALVVSRL